MRSHIQRSTELEKVFKNTKITYKKHRKIRSVNCSCLRTFESIGHRGYYSYRNGMETHNWKNIYLNRFSKLQLIKFAKLLYLQSETGTRGYQSGWKGGGRLKFKGQGDMFFVGANNKFPLKLPYKMDLSCAFLI